MELNEIKERMASGKLYFCDDPTLMREQLAALDLLYDFNATRPTEMEKRTELLKKMFAEIGENCYIEPPLHANWAGKHVHFGKNIYANFGLTLVDDGDIFVGDSTMFGPNVIVDTATHPISPKLREKVAQYNLPIHIGRNVWIGGGSVILPGVTIGDNTVIGAGSIVTHDIPANVVAYGSPCRVARPITEEDDRVYDKTRKVDIG